MQPHSGCADQNDQDDGRWLEARVRVRGQAPRDEAERGVPTASRLFLVGATESQSREGGRGAEAGKGGGK